MKNSAFLTLILSFLMTGALLGQGLQVTTYAEQTKKGTKLGTAMGINLAHNFGVGAFYQQSVQKFEAEQFRPLMEENEFFGIYMTGNMYKTELFSLNAMVRTGVTNRENFAITPSILATFKLAKMIEFNAGMGVRCFNPTLTAGLTIKMSK